VYLLVQEAVEGLGPWVVEGVEVEAEGAHICRCASHMNTWVMPAQIFEVADLPQPDIEYIEYRGSASRVAS
jgi:hypothetical protein